MTTPAHDTCDEAAAIACGARQSILIMATAGLIGYSILTAFFWLGAFAWLLIPTDPVFNPLVLAGGVFSVYGLWVFVKLLRCGLKLRPDGLHLDEAMELHRQFWSHAPYVSVSSFVILLPILWPGIQGHPNRPY